MASLTLKRVVAAGLAAVVVGSAAVGYVNAQGGGPDGNQPGQRQGINREAMRQRHEQYLNTLAGKLGVTPDRLKQAIMETHNELGGPRRPGGPGAQRPGPWRAGLNLDAAAQAMNITQGQLRQELPGKTLTQVAEAHNVAPSTVADALKKAVTDRIDRAVTNNRITTDQANQAKQNLDQRISQLMSRTFPAPGQNRGPRQGRSNENGPQEGQQPQTAPLSFAL
jgi:hypothetical protein